MTKRNGAAVDVEPIHTALLQSSHSQQYSTLLLRVVEIEGFGNSQTLSAEGFVHLHLTPTVKTHLSARGIHASLPKTEKILSFKKKRGGREGRGAWLPTAARTKEKAVSNLVEVLHGFSGSGEELFRSGDGANTHELCNTCHVTFPS